MRTMVRHRRSGTVFSLVPVFVENSSFETVTVIFIRLIRNLYEKQFSTLKTNMSDILRSSGYPELSHGMQFAQQCSEYLEIMSKNNNPEAIPNRGSKYIITVPDVGIQLLKQDHAFLQSPRKFLQLQVLRVVNSLLEKRSKSKAAHPSTMTDGCTG